MKILRIRRCSERAVITIYNIISEIRSYGLVGLYKVNISWISATQWSFTLNTHLGLNPRRDLS